MTNQVINHEIDEGILDTFAHMKDNISHLLRCKLELNHARKRDQITEAEYCDKVTGRVECLARWFIKASDHQVAMVGAGADAPYSLVYRIGGVTHDSWDYDWVDAETLTLTLSPKPQSLNPKP